MQSGSSAGSTSWTHSGPRHSRPGNQAIQRALGGAPGRAARDPHPVAATGFSGPASPLPHHETIGRAFGPLADLTGVQTYQGGSAAAACADLGARAYTSGDRIAFSGKPDLRTSAHEAAHVVQQRAGLVPSGIDRPGDRFERNADEVADRVVQGRSAADLLPTGNGAGAGPAVQRQSDAGVEPSPPPPASPYDRPVASDIAQQVRGALSQVGPVAGVGNFPAAYSILNGLSMLDLLRVLTELRNSHDIEILVANFGSAAQFNQGRLQIAMTVVLSASGGSGPFPGDPDALINAVHSLPPDQCNELMVYLAGSTPPQTEQDVARFAGEGQQVLNQEQGMSMNPAAPFMGMAGVFGPGLWAPGQIPIGFYIGNAAHIGIAAYYTMSHIGEVVFTNFFSVGSILRQISSSSLGTRVAPPTGPSPADLDGEPDIANMTLRHLYEIKPEGSEALALTEALEYQAAFAMSGIPMELGPTMDPGVNGVFYDIGWYFIFESPEPGVITYRRQSRPLEPVYEPVRETSEAPSEAPERSFRFSFPQLSREQQRQLAINMTAVATVGMASYLMYLLVFAL